SNAFADASPVRSLAACDPNGFVRNWLIESSATGACGEQIESRFAPAPVLAQDLQQGWTQRQVAIFATLARNHPEDHPLTIDIGDFKVSEFAASHAGAVERHQQRPSKQVSCGID